MKIIALSDFWMNGSKGYEKGKEYTVSDDLGKLFVTRGHAEEVKAVEQKKDKKK